MPVSTFTWTFSFFPAARAAAERARPVSRSGTFWVRSSSSSRAACSGGVAPRMRMGPPTPAARSSAASLTQATARYSAPSSFNFRATGTAPWP